MAPPRAPLTHFLCIPLTTPTSRPHLSRALTLLRADVSTPDASGPALLPPEAVRPPGSLHLTLGVMSFPKNEGLDLAVDLLKQMKPREMLREAIVAATDPTAMQLRTTAVATSAVATPNATQTKTPVTTTDPGARNVGDAPRSSLSIPEASFSITLRGLRVMGSNPTKTSVVYAPPADDLGILQRFAEAVRAAFCVAGLVTDEGRPLLLHATVLNTVYVREGGRGGGRGSGGGRGRGKGKWGKRLEVDATALLDRYEEHVWLEGLPLDRLAICKMGAKTIQGPDGEEDAEYEVEAEVEF